MSVDRAINARSGRIDYSVLASQTVLRSAEGDPEVRMFAVNYFKKGADPRTRPVTFCFNGGPGSATIWLHMGGLGPKMAPMLDDGNMAPPPYKVIDNPDTWLEFTDLVFVDAPGTGFSRLLRPDLRSKYFGVRNDIAAFTQYVKNWLTENKRWTSPIFIAGESYGGIRGSGLTARLFDAGVAVEGFISISGTASYLTLDAMRGNDVPHLGFFPSLAVTAWHHGKGPKRFKSEADVAKEVIPWVENVYGPALIKGSSLPDEEKEKIAAKMAEYLGLSKAFCLGSNLRVDEFPFFRELLREKSLTVGRLDSRIVGREEQAMGPQRISDPSNDALTSPYLSSLRGYLEEDLGVKTSMDYFIFGSVSPWTTAEGSYSETASDLRKVLMANPHLRVLYACGYYDLACPFYATHYTVNHMNLDKEARSRVSFTYYPAGHMMYIEKGSREQLTRDAREFITRGR